MTSTTENAAPWRELTAEVELPPLDELLAMLGHAAEDLDLIVEHLTVHRQGLDDAARLSLRGVESDVGQAWAWATRALGALREHVAVRGV